MCQAGSVFFCAHSACFCYAFISCVLNCYKPC
jgi:hypothetical protein